MILAIDTGNTHTVLGCLENGRMTADPVRIATDRGKTEFEYAAGIEQIFSLTGIDRNRFDGAILSSVVPAVTMPLARAVRLVTGIMPLIVGPGTKTGLHIAIDDPGTIAADLVATAVAAKELCPLPCVIIDMGTATTITVVNKEGNFIGGAILPGVNLSLNALTAGTSLLPAIDMSVPKKPIGSNTIDCMRSGIIYGSAGQIDGVIDRFEESMGEPFKGMIATGGLASVICPFCRHEIEVDPELLLKGLYMIWEKNAGRTGAPKKKN